MAGDMMPLDNPDPAKSPEIKAKRAAAAAKSARKARKGERRARGGQPAKPARRPHQAQMTKLAIFDCDGTLVDSGATIHAALPASVRGARAGMPAARGDQEGHRPEPDRGDGGAGAGRRSCGADPTYKDAFFAMRGAGRVEEPLFDGIVELLDALEADDWLLGVATGKSDRGLRHCLESHGLGDRFVTLQTADRNPSKPHPAMALAAMAEAGASRRAPFSSATPAGTWAARAMPASARSARAGAIMKSRN